MLDTSDPGRRPDAIRYTLGWEPPVPWSGESRIERLCRYFETILGAETQQRAHIRVIGGQEFLVSLSPFDTLLYPEGDQYAKWARYDWEPAPDGLKYGYLKVTTS